MTPPKEPFDGEAENPSGAPEVAKRPLRAVIAEDDEADVELISYVLEKAGLHVELHRVDTEAAFLTALEPAPDLILADYVVPKLGAARALTLVQERALDVPFIVISGLASADEAVSMLKAGASDFLNKYDLSRLPHAVERELREAQVRAAKRRAEAALKRAHEALSLAQRASGSVICDWDLVTGDVYVSPEYRKLFGHRPEEPIGHKDWLKRVHPDDRERMAAAARELLAHGADWNVEFRFMHPDRGMLWLAGLGRLSRDAQGRPLRFTGINLDITGRKAAEARIEHLASFNYDTLTGLPNRALLMDLIERSVAQSARNQQRLALLYIDFDNLKAVNDSLGHTVGDELLKEVAARLRGCVRESDFLGRLGGDEFVMLLTGLKGSADAARVAEKIIAAVGREFQLTGHVLHTSCSIGISTYPGDAGNVDALIQHGDAAMYKAKALGGGRYHFYVPERESN
jgi:diguanylate cyclase (GGDEF)-like protein/PAS domain S-box-containing protein